MQARKRTQTSNTILFGNGINRLHAENQSWDELLKSLNASTLLTKGHLPNTMIYEGILFETFAQNKLLHNEDDGVLAQENGIKQQIADAYAKMHTQDIYKSLAALNADNYLTTNYDYAFRNSISDVFQDYKSKSTEAIYSIRRRIELQENNVPVANIWHIHGEIDYPKTIMLGIDHYCGEIGKIDALIKGNYEFVQDGEPIRLASIKQKLVESKTDGMSWVELFFTSNIYILGFSFDFCEIDLWWILTKRARLMRDKTIGKQIRNKIRFYCTEISPEKKSLFESLGVEIIIIPLENENYELNYLSTISNIASQIGQKAKG